MNTYLTFITTVLVLTQIIRVIQNAMQLRKMEEKRVEEKKITAMWRQMTDAMNRFVDKV
jgi:hypothetical protein